MMKIGKEERKQKKLKSNVTTFSFKGKTSKKVKKIKQKNKITKEKYEKM